MSRYRILRMITWLPQGGIERKIAAVLPKLNRDLFDVHMCCIRERGPLADDLEKAGIPVHLIPFGSRLDPMGLLKLRRLTKRLGIHLIHSHMYRSNTPATIMKLVDRRLKVVGHYHNVNTWESQRQENLDRYLALRRDMNVAVSEAVRKDVVARLKIPNNKTTTLYNCVDLDEFRPMAGQGRIEARAALGYGPQHKVVVMVARMVRQKNHELVIRSAREILQTVPETRFLFVGGGPDEEKLIALATKLGVLDAITFLGRRDDVPRLLAAADVAILPSLKEGFSNAVLEAMACGTPLVVSNVGGNAEIIDHGANGFICDVANASSEEPTVNEVQFLRFLKRLLMDNEFRDQMGAAALETVRHYGIDSMVREVERLYLEILEAP
jgi:glycosyltransferase involved in cell wall biosynthesis